MLVIVLSLGVTNLRSEFGIHDDVVTIAISDAVWYRLIQLHLISAAGNPIPYQLCLTLSCLLVLIEGR